MRARIWMTAGLLLAAAGCGKAPEETGAGGEASVLAAEIVAVAAADLPADVRAAALARIPDLAITGAERKRRDGMTFYDVEGTRGDGSEVELDLIEEGGRWRVVEVQRDIAWADAPAEVRAAAAAAPDAFAPVRVIESVQADGAVIYELFAAGRPGEPASEVDWKDGRAAMRRTRNAY
ncbi:MAG TPA: hypothetical protein PKD99_10530 [Sphingopyxis sp.]|nr:hypothetical protein [Sphingopyxis sp.]HMP45531.1 hypothetical protein [Sphingopyxis sp.]HMQ18874.1 hypothetical protein [Sphingopyxis sp.]